MSTFGNKQDGSKLSPAFSGRRRGRGRRKRTSQKNECGRPSPFQPGFEIFLAQTQGIFGDGAREFPKRTSVGAPPPLNPALKYSVRLRTEYLGTAQENFPKPIALRPPPLNPALKYSLRKRKEYLGTAQENFPKPIALRPSPF